MVLVWSKSGIADVRQRRYRFLEELIRKIVEADKRARNNVASKKQMKNNVQDQIQEKKEEIKAKYQEETKRCIYEKRTEMDKELAVSMKQEEKDFEEALQQMQAHYEKHRDEWVNRIVTHCLDA